MTITLLDQRGSKEDRVAYWLQQFERATSTRATFEGHWSQVAKKIYPEADQFQQSLRTPGDKRRQLVYSSHASRALKKWISWMISLTIPKTSQWQRFKASDPELNKDAGVKAFFEEFTRLVFKVRNRPSADFYGSMYPHFADRGAFGNGCFFMEETEDEHLVKYLPIALSRVWIQVDHYRRVQTVFYKSCMSAAAAHMKWQKVWGKSPPPKVKSQLEKNPWEDMYFLHVVTPRQGRNPDSFGPERMPYESLYIAMDDRELIEEGGYWEMPYVFGREPQLANEHYGRGIGMMILPEMGTLDAMKKTHLFSGERKANPPVLLADDDFGQGARVLDLRPGGMNRGTVSRDGKPLMAPFDNGARLDITREMMQDEEAAIDDSFGLNLFRILLEDPRGNVTATEILKRAQEKADLIAPTANSLQSETFGPETERLVGIISRAGLVGPLPQALVEANGDYEIEHIAPVNQLQRSGELAAIQQAIEVAMPFIQLDPTQAQRFDLGEILERHIDVQGGPPQALRSKDEFAQILAQIQQAQAQQAQMEQAREIAGAAKDGAQALQVIQGGAGA